jgi:hypothetical protein
MEAFEQQIGQYFDDYCQRFNDALEGKNVDTDGITGSFSENVFESSPEGLKVSGSEQVKEKVPKNFEFYRSIGTTCMIIDKKEITPIDEGHALAKIHWKANYDQGKTGEMIDFSTFYMMRREDDAWKCFGYIAGDEQRAWKDHGLMK